MSDPRPSEAAPARALRAAWWRVRIERVQGAGVVVFLLLALGLSFPYFERTHNANEWPRLMQGIAIVEDGDWSLDGPAARRMGQPGPDHAISEHDGRRYPNKPPGASLVAAAAYRIAKAWAGATSEPLTLRAYTWWARVLGGLLPTVVLCGVLLVRMSPALGRMPAVAGVVVYAVGTPAAAYAHLLYGHQLAAALLFLGIGLLADASGRATLRGSRPRETTRAIMAGAGGLLAGGAVVVEYAAVFAAIPIAVLLLARARTRSGAIAIGCGVLGALVPTAWLASYHAQVYGSPWITGYHQSGTARFAELHGQGLLGLSWPSLQGLSTHVLSADGGLLWWVPGIVLAMWSLASLAWSHDTAAADGRAEARVHLAIALGYLVILTGLSFDGGWRVGPRYYVIALPSLAMGFALAVAHARTHAGWYFAIVALTTYGVIVNALAANLWPHLDLTNVNQPVAEVLMPLWARDLQPYGVLRTTLGLQVVHLVVYGTVVVTWLALARTAEPSIRNAIAGTLGAAIGILMVYTTFLVPPHPRGPANLAYIVERAWEPVRDSVEPAPSLVLWRPPR